MATTLTPVLTARWDTSRSWTLDSYVDNGGYTALRTALGMDPADIVAAVKDSGLRGRGGAGFPAGMKWGFLPAPDGGPRYLVVNADESEPGTCKDIPLMMADPHLLVEGTIITAFAIGCHSAFIYVRGEVLHVYRRVLEAVAQAREAGYLGSDILGSGFDLEIVVHAGAGAYICGEETALLNSLEGRRGEPRVKPPFPATKGAYGQPTTVNNVETLASVPVILRLGGAVYAGIGTPNNTGTRIFGVSGHVKRPGLYELPLGTPMDFLVNDLAGGCSTGKPIKAIIPGGCSAPMLDAKDFDCPMDFDAMKARGTMAGSGGVIVMDEDVCIVEAVLRLTRFYAHESCGQCTPCREGCNWLEMVLHRIEHGEGRPGDLDLIASLTPRINLRTLCPLGDAACGPIDSALQKFRHEFEHHIEHKTCFVKGQRLTALTGAH